MATQWNEAPAAERSHAVVEKSDRWTECVCGHIFTGADTVERATAHVADPARDAWMMDIMLVREGES